MEQVKDLLMLALLNMGIVDYFAEPAKKKFPDIDFWWLKYVALATGLTIGIVSGINVFTELDPVVGLILTGCLIGGGSKLIYDFLDLGGNVIGSIVRR